MQNPILLSSLFLCLVACSGTRASQSSGGSSGSQVKEDASQWLEPTPQLQTEMDMMRERMPWIKGPEESQDMIEWWTQLGEPGYATLLEIAQDPKAKVADLAYAALAGSRDKRLVSSLREIPWDETSPQRLQYSRARTHLRLGDWSHIDVLIKGLRDESEFSRAYCAQILKTATNNDFGYQYNAPVEERAAAVEKWEAWYQERAAEAVSE